MSEVSENLGWRLMRGTSRSHGSGGTLVTPPRARSRSRSRGEASARPSSTTSAETTGTTPPCLRASRATKSSAASLVRGLASRRPRSGGASSRTSTSRAFPAPVASPGARPGVSGSPAGTVCTATADMRAAPTCQPATRSPSRTSSTPRWPRSSPTSSRARCMCAGGSSSRRVTVWPSSARAAEWGRTCCGSPLIRVQR